MAQTEVIIPKQEGGSPTPLTLYGDWTKKKCPPTILMSHGLGGSEDAFSSYGPALADAGYRVAVMGHGEKGKGHILKLLLGKDPAPVLQDKKKWKRRFQDLDAAYGYVTRDCRPDKLILAGHSMGAATTMLEAGAKGLVDYGGKDRFDAYIALSPQGIGWMFESGAWQSVKKPVLMITGTKDRSFEESYKWRFDAFNGLPPGNKRLAVIDKAGHSDIGGRTGKKTHKIVAKIMIEFLDKYMISPFPQSKYTTQADIKDK